MKILRSLLLLFLFGSLISCRSSHPDFLSAIDPGRYDTTWWNRAPLRMIQTNLRETDAQMDKEAYVRSLVDASANIVLLNVGGIVANYPTELEYQYKNTFMQGDLAGDLIKELHNKGIKVFGRFDFSKLNECYAVQKPEWLYKGTDGKSVNYNGQVHTCINGGYQQEYAFKILQEAISKLPFDGIFFNMIGYTTTDYSRVYHGICQCDNCKNRFMEYTGLTLPVKEDYKDPIYLQYVAFKKKTSDELFQKTGSFIKELNPNLVICTYTDAGVDIVRSESGTEVESLSEWNYISTDHVKLMLGSYLNKIPSNATNHFMGIRFRHVATSPNVSRVRTLENMMNGAMLDFYCVGTLVNQEDKVFLPVLNDLYGFHKEYEKLFTNLQPKTDVLLIKGSDDEYRGIIKLLSEEHIQFDIMDPDVILNPDVPRKLSDYELVILGDNQNLSDELIDAIDSYVKEGGKILATGFTSINNEIGIPLNRLRLNCFGVEPLFELFPKSDATYLKVTESDLNTLGKSEFESLTLLMMYSGFLKCNPSDGATGFLKLVPEAMYGPPEKCYYTEITDFPGLVYNNFGKGKSVFIPWKLGENYFSKGHHAHKKIFMASMEKLLEYSKTVITDATPLIEVSHMFNRNGAFEWIGMINHSGQIGQSYLEPIPILNTHFRIRPEKPVREIRMIRSGKPAKFKQTDEYVDFIVPEIGDFEMALVLYK